MTALMNDIVSLNLARDYYIENNLTLSLEGLRNVKSFDCTLLMEEIKGYSGNVAFLENEERSEHLLGIFECPYHPCLRMEYSRIEDVYPTIVPKAKFDNIRCVIQHESTYGIANEQVVALFPENFKSVNVLARHPVFYFVNKFSQRHIKYTRPILEGILFESIFQPLIHLSQNRINQIVSNWVIMHEESHRTGNMPLPVFLEEKSNQYTAAFEELRADLLTIKSCFNSFTDESSDTYLTGLYVLAERLLAYPLFREKSNFDTISSVLLWRFFYRKENSLAKIKISTIKENIEELLFMMSDIETEVLMENKKSLRKSKMKRLVKGMLGDYENEFESYKLYWSIK